MIVSWQKINDYPDPTEGYDNFGLSFNEEELDEDELSVLEEVFAESPNDKDKLLGWPVWVYGPMYPACPECEGEMNHIFQI